MIKRPPAGKVRDLLLAFVCVGFAVAAPLAAIGYIQSGKADDHAASAESHAASASDAAVANQAGIGEANAQIRKLGGTPVPTPSPVAGASGAAGAPGRGPSQAAIQTAVDVFCALHSNCTGTPSQAQVRAAVAAYCNAGACTGATGKTGATGDTGDAGATGQPGGQGPQGAQGDGPSTDQVQAAVAAFCSAHGDCTGPAGPQGEKGETGDTGKTGRGIASIDCTGLGVDSLTITYDDGTKSTVPCDLAPATEPPTGTETP